MISDTATHTAVAAYRLNAGDTGPVCDESVAE